MPSAHEAWLKLTVEDPIDPALPICDSHHHLWDHAGDRYLLEDFLRDASGGHNIVRTVFMECGSMYRKGGPVEMQPVGETEFAQGIAAQTATGQSGATAVAAGIVGYADLTLGDAVAPIFEAHLAAGSNRFRGIRQSCAWHESPQIRSSGKAKGMMSDPQFRQGFACLQRYGLSFDANQHFTQLMELVDLARAFPDTPMIVVHTGGILGTGPYAGKQTEVFREWKSGMTRLATCPNVAVKLGGLGLPRSGFGWHERPKPPNSAELAEMMSPYYHTCIELFGADRCMFESNFPPDKVSYSYTVLWNAFKRVTEDCSAGERAALFHDTAARVYRLAS